MSRGSKGSRGSRGSEGSRTLRNPSNLSNPYDVSPHVLAPRPEQLIQWFRSTCLGLPESPWERLKMDVPAIAFGPGSRCQFGHYFEGRSAVQVATVDDIVDWLNTCEYASDAEQFNDRDVWQEPCAFEQRRRGDCEDFALWAWRKLGELGLDAEFFVGRVICGEDPARSTPTRVGRLSRPSSRVSVRARGARPAADDSPARRSEGSLRAALRDRHAPGDECIRRVCHGPVSGVACRHSVHRDVIRFQPAVEVHLKADTTAL